MLLVGVQAILISAIGIALSDTAGDCIPLTDNQMASIRGDGTVYRACNTICALGCSSACELDPISGKWHKTIGNAMYRCGNSTVAPDKPCGDDVLCFCGLGLSFNNEADCSGGEHYDQITICSYAYGCKDTYNPWGCKWSGPGQ